jgi:hypothetical protein
MRYAVSGRNPAGAMISEGFRDAVTALRNVDTFLAQNLTDIRIMDELGHFLSYVELQQRAERVAPRMEASLQIAVTPLQEGDESRGD